jgi:hypothetical protein
MEDKQWMGDGELALQDGSAELVEFVCMAKHAADPSRGHYTLAQRTQLTAYCPRGAEQNHEWVRVPPTPVNEITTGIMEERPPEPATPRHRVLQTQLNSEAP